jgi:hypothetical protein
VFSVASQADDSDDDCDEDDDDSDDEDSDDEDSDDEDSGDGSSDEDEKGGPLPRTGASPFVSLMMVVAGLLCVFTGSLMILGRRRLPLDHSD